MKSFGGVLSVVLCVEEEEEEEEGTDGKYCRGRKRVSMEPRLRDKGGGERGERATVDVRRNARKEISATVGDSRGQEGRVGGMDPVTGLVDENQFFHDAKTSKTGTHFWQPTRPILPLLQ